MQGRLFEIALANRIDIRPETAFSAFVQTEGQVTGLVAETGTGSIRIGAKRGILINAGGFSHNLALRREHGKQPASASWTSANPGDTGEVLPAAIELGAATDCMDEAIWTMISLGPDEALPPDALLPSGEIAHFGHHQTSPTHSRSSSIKRASASPMKPGLTWKWASVSMTAIRKKRGRHSRLGDPRQSAPAILSLGRHLGATRQSWIDSGYMIKAGSIEDLAARTGIPADGLKAEITRINGFCQVGKDEDFGRGDGDFDRSTATPTSSQTPIPARSNARPSTRYASIPATSARWVGWSPIATDGFYAPMAV